MSTAWDTGYIRINPNCATPSLDNIYINKLDVTPGYLQHLEYSILKALMKKWQ